MDNINLIHYKYKYYYVFINILCSMSIQIDKIHLED